MRQEIIWAKAYTTNDRNYGSAMPESVSDRFVKSHEQVFLLSKSRQYYFDLESVKKPITESSTQRLSQDVSAQIGSERVPGKTNGTMKAVIHKNQSMHEARKGYEHRGSGDQILTVHSGNYDSNGNLIGQGFANKRSVWHINLGAFKEAHFATFPQELIVDMIKAGCPENGVVLDPFFGAGTTGLVARKLNRNYIGIELNPDYVKMAQDRIQKELGLFV